MPVSPRIADRIPRHGHERPNRPNSYGLPDGRPETPNLRGLPGSRPETPKPGMWSGCCTRRAGACACSVKYLKNRHRVAPLCRTPCTVCGGSPEARVFWAFQPGQRWNPRQLGICGQAPRKPLFHAGFESAPSLPMFALYCALSTAASVRGRLNLCVIGMPAADTRPQ